MCRRLVELRACLDPFLRLLGEGGNAKDTRSQVLKCDFFFDHYVHTISQIAIFKTIAQRGMSIQSNNENMNTRMSKIHF
jgi:hypothetical protein